MPVITLPDGSKREYPQPLTVAEVAASIGAGLAKAAIAGKVDGRLVDTSHRIEGDVAAARTDGAEHRTARWRDLIAQPIASCP